LRVIRGSGKLRLPRRRKEWENRGFPRSRSDLIGVNVRKQPVINVKIQKKKSLWKEGFFYAKI
jgi:hypothetical protein